MGIVRIALEYALRFAAGGPAGLGPGPLRAAGHRRRRRRAALVAETAAFVWERLQALLLDEGLPFPIVEAALARRAPPTCRRWRRGRASSPLCGGRDFFDDAVTAYNRCASLAAKAGGRRRGASTRPCSPRPPSVNCTPPGRGRAARSLDALAHLELESALEAAAGLRPAVDRYFDDVLVMDDDPAVRANRLAQLRAPSSALLRPELGRVRSPAGEVAGPRTADDATHRGQDLSRGGMMASKYVYGFSEGNKEMKELLGGKGANLAEMTEHRPAGAARASRSPPRSATTTRRTAATPTASTDAGRGGARRTSRPTPASASATPPTRCCCRCAPAPAPACPA